MNTESNKQVRVLHVVGGMNYGGVETWLMHVLRHIDRKRFHMDFLVHTDNPCVYDDEIRMLGSDIIPCLKPSHPFQYAMNFFRITKERAPYDVIHSHVHHYSGFVLWLAQLVGIPLRIAHSHSDTMRNDSHATLQRNTYLSTMKCLLSRNAIIGLAASHEAAQALYGQNWENDPRWRILYCGVDLVPFSKDINGVAIRKELNIPEDAFVVGHVGRFTEVKNHIFMVDIAACLAMQFSNMRMLFIGNGPLLQEIERKVNRLGLKEKVIFAGLRSDVPRLMLGAMDVFLMPSLHEGLPLVLMEAQAAGLPCIFSDVVSKETDVVPYFVHRTSLDLPPEIWAKKVIDAAKAAPISKKQALELVSQSAFNINMSVEHLEKVYLQK